LTRFRPALHPITQDAGLFALRLLHGAWLLRSASFALSWPGFADRPWVLRGAPPGVGLAIEALDASLAALLLVGLGARQVGVLGLALSITRLAVLDPDAWWDARPWAPEPLLESPSWLAIVAYGTLAAVGAGRWSADGWRHARVAPQESP
jgi:hypothetical protein